MRQHPQSKASYAVWLDKSKDCRGATPRRRNYGMTVEEYERLSTEQGGVCFVCGDPPKGFGNGAASSLHVDHDHETGAIRRLLCCNCNMGVGFFRDDPALMERTADYIRADRK